MTMRFSSLRDASAWLLAMLVACAVTLLWLPQRAETRGEGSAGAARAMVPEALQPGAQISRDKGHAPRATLLNGPGGDERKPAPPPGTIAATSAADVPHRLLRSPTHPSGAIGCARPLCHENGARAPPRA